MHIADKVKIFLNFTENPLYKCLLLSAPADGVSFGSWVFWPACYCPGLPADLSAAAPGWLRPGASPSTCQLLGASPPPMVVGEPQSWHSVCVEQAAGEVATRATMMTAAVVMVGGTDSSDGGSGSEPSELRGTFWLCLLQACVRWLAVKCSLQACKVAAGS